MKLMLAGFEQVTLAFCLLTTIPAFAGTTFQVIRCQKAYDDQVLSVDLQFSRQVRDANDNFVQSGLFQVAVNLVESPTTLGRIEAAGKSTMTWKRQPGTGPEAHKNTAVSEDGSLFASSAIKAPVFDEEIANLGAQIPAATFFNDVDLYSFKIKVNSPVVDYLAITLQSVDFSGSAHIQISAVNKGGVDPLSQFDVDCENDVTYAPLF